MSAVLFYTYFLPVYGASSCLCLITSGGYCFVLCYTNATDVVCVNVFLVRLQLDALHLHHVGLPHFRIYLCVIVFTQHSVSQLTYMSCSVATTIIHHVSRSAAAGCCRGGPAKPTGHLLR